ncbi:GPI ethanolamine phosphate transferase 1 [Diplonema papillatum]|nr:GPI ethanolamine phosphate transferase 1 [Diplonema papillatum]
MLDRVYAPLTTPRGYLAASVLFHLLYCLCALDVYYKSPLESSGEMRPHRSSLTPLAKRLVFITLDGAPADYVFKASQRDLLRERDGGKGNSGKPTMGFVHELFEEREDVCWGVTHTHVPTESRPGHVALIGGFYEDPSAVTTGWQENPDKSFDTVWREASRVWQWGAPEIVQIFKGGRNDTHITTTGFPESLNDFSGDPAAVDEWVLEAMTRFFNETAPANPALDAELRGDRTAFFLHFLGMDSAGHKYGTGGEGYVETLAHADKCLRGVVDAFSSFYGEGHDRTETAFVITADHGMTKRGSHGDGSPEETRVPLIVFGAGVNERCNAAPRKIRRPSPRNSDKPPFPAGGDQKYPETPPFSPAGESPAKMDPRASGIHFWDEAFASLEAEEAYVETEWGMRADDRQDLEPADVAMLMAGLLSIPLPKHAEGTMPTGYLARDPRVRAHAILSNVKQAHERLRSASDLRKSRSALFNPWPQTTAAEAKVDAIQQSTTGPAQNHTWVVEEGPGVVKLLQTGFSYYRYYDYSFMAAAVAFAYTTWFLFSLTLIACLQEGAAGESGQKEYSGFGLFCGVWVVVAVVWLRGMPLLKAGYMLAPLCFWPVIVREAAATRRFVGASVNAWHGAASVLAVLVVTAGFYQREAFSAGLGAFGVGLGVVGNLTRRTCGPPEAGLSKWLALALLPGFCAFCGLFTLLPCVGSLGAFTRLVAPTGVASALVAGAFASYHPSISTALFLTPCLLLFGASILVVYTDHLQATSQGLPLANRLAAWGCLIAALALPRFNTNVVGKLPYCLVCLQIPMVILSVGYEPLLLLVLSVLLCTAHAVYKADLPVPALGTALFFLVYFGFFATGNIASVSSFDLPSVYRLQTQFDKLIMGALLVFKLWIPLLAVLCAVQFMVEGLQRMFSVVAYAVALSDIVSLFFFLSLRDEGSWKQIGHSISCFVIANLLTVILLVLWGLSSVFIGPKPSSVKQHPS